MVCKTIFVDPFRTDRGLEGQTWSVELADVRVEEFGDRQRVSACAFIAGVGRIDGQKGGRGDRLSLINTPPRRDHSASPRQE